MLPARPSLSWPSLPRRRVWPASSIAAATCLQSAFRPAGSVCGLSPTPGQSGSHRVPVRARPDAEIGMRSDGGVGRRPTCSASSSHPGGPPFLLSLSARNTRSTLARLSLRADVAELVDAHGSGPCALRGVEVQVLSSASHGRRIGSPGCSIQRFRSHRDGRTFSARRRVRLADVDPRRPRPARRAGTPASGRRDRRRPGDRLGNAVAFVVRAADPDRRPRAVSAGPRSGARDVVQRPRRDRGRAALVARRATQAGMRRSTACGSTWIPTSDRPGSRASGSTAKRPAWPERVDEARVAGPAARCAVGALAAACRPTSIRTDI